MSNLCLQLWEEIYKCKLETESYWPRFWAGDKTLNPGNVLSILDHLREFYVRMHAEYKELLAQLPRSIDGTPKHIRNSSRSICPRR